MGLDSQGPGNHFPNWGPSAHQVQEYQRSSWFLELELSPENLDLALGWARRLELHWDRALQHLVWCSFFLSSFLSPFPHFLSSFPTPWAPGGRFSLWSLKAAVFIWKDLPALLRRPTMPSRPSTACPHLLGKRRDGALSRMSGRGCVPQTGHYFLNLSPPYLKYSVTVVGRNVF